MKSVNINCRNSEYFTSFSYPAGERQTRLTESGLAAVTDADEVNIYLDDGIKDADYITLIQLRDAIDSVRAEMGRIKINLHVPYLPYSRADRRFAPGDTDGLGVFMRLLFLNFDKIITWDVHNPSVDCFDIPGFENIKAEPTIMEVIRNLASKSIATQINLLFPDKGALERYDIPSEIDFFHYKISVNKLYCTKRRDEVTGKLLGFNVPELKEFKTASVLIVDDICDAGGTFLGIVSELENKWKVMCANSPDLANFLPLHMNLYVTHGIFSKGYDTLLSKFHIIYTTKSFDHSTYKDANPSGVFGRLEEVEYKK